MERCVPEVIEEGNERDRAVAMCSSMFEERSMANLKPRGNEKRSTFLNRCDNKLHAAHAWRMYNQTHFDVQDMPDGLLLPMLANRDDEQLKLFVTQDIVDPLEVDEAVRMLRDNSEMDVDLEINSMGGSVPLAMGLFNALQDHVGFTTARVTGIAASAGMLLSQAVDLVRIHDNAQMMMHPGSAFMMLKQEFGKAQEAHDFVDFIDEMLQKGTDQIIDLLSNRSGMKRSKVEEMVTAKNGFGTTITGKEAVEMGFADELIPAKARGKKMEESTKNAAIKAWREREMANCLDVDLELDTATTRMIEMGLRRKEYQENGSAS